MFLDRKLGANGVIPESRNIPDTYYITNERRLYVRLTSPHEYDESPAEFINKAREKMGSGRWCFAGALQPGAFKKMPNAVESIRLFIAEFKPERVRAVFLSPNRHGKLFSEFSDDRDLLRDLLDIPSVEVACIDARRRRSNGLLLADFFDFS